MNQFQSLEAVLDSDIVVIVDDEEWRALSLGGDPNLSILPTDDGNRSFDEGWIRTGILVGSLHPGRARKVAIVKRTVLVAFMGTLVAAGYFAFGTTRSEDPKPAIVAIAPPPALSPDSILASTTPISGETGPVINGGTSGSAEKDPDPGIQSSGDVEPDGPNIPATNPPVTGPEPLAIPDVDSGSKTGTPPKSLSLASTLLDLASSPWKKAGSAESPSTIPKDPEMTEDGTLEGDDEFDDDSVPTVQVDGKVYALDSGETILELHNGAQFRGKIKRIRDGRITLVQGNGSLTFEIDKLKAILGNDFPELRPFELLPRASVHLKNGSRFSGRVARDDASEVVLRTESGSIQFPRNEIAEIAYTLPNAPLITPVPNQSRDEWKLISRGESQLPEDPGALKDWSPGVGVHEIAKDLDRVSEVQILSDWRKPERKKSPPRKKD